MRFSFKSQFIESVSSSWCDKNVWSKFRILSQLTINALPVSRIFLKMYSFLKNLMWVFQAPDLKILLTFSVKMETDLGTKITLMIYCSNSQRQTVDCQICELTVVFSYWANWILYEWGSNFLNIFRFREILEISNSWELQRINVRYSL